MGDYHKDMKIDVSNETKRSNEIEKAIGVFKTHYKDVHNIELSTIDFAADKLTNLYFTLLRNYVKPFVPKKVNRYKIASLTELCIVKIQPFYIENESQSRKVNANFAFFTTLSIIFDISKGVEGFNKSSSHLYVENLFENVKIQRLQWLESKNKDDFSIFCNGLTLYILFELYHLKFQALAS